MSPGNRAEYGDQNDENGTRWNCIAKQGSDHIPRRQIFGRDSRTDDSSQQEHCAEPFAAKGPVKIMDQIIKLLDSDIEIRDMNAPGTPCPVQSARRITDILPTC